MDIAHIIREHRLKNKKTQSELAEILNVTNQAVSKWERGESYPDITQLPFIALYFGISLDELCGMDEYRSNDRKNKRINELGERRTDGITEELISDWRKLFREYPNDNQIILDFAGLLYSANNPVNNNKLNEAIKILEDYLLHCHDEPERSYAVSRLIDLYNIKGAIESGLALASSQPSIVACREIVTQRFLTGDILTGTRQSIMLSFIRTEIIQYLFEFGANPEERLYYIGKALDLINWLFDETASETDFLVSENYRVDCYSELAKIYCLLYDVDAAVKWFIELVKSALLLSDKCAIEDFKYEQNPFGCKLLDHYSEKGFYENHVQKTLNDIENGEFDILKDNVNFIGLVDRLKAVQTS